MKIKVKVPATTANFGSGFDCLGMALPIYNEITIEENVMPGSGIEINIISETDQDDGLAIEHIPTDKNNIVYKAIELLYNSIGQVPSDLTINIKSEIPIARGLGSSASVIIGGLIAANELLGRPADEAALLSIATEVEGHPDNIAPALLGGLVLSSLEDDGSVIYKKIDWPSQWSLTVCIPDYELATDISRSVLPKEVSLKDASFNSRRIAMLVHAINTQDAELMKLGLQDKLHQPYRMKLVPGLTEIISQLKHEENVLGCVLSGAGPAILIISQKNNLDKIKSTVSAVWADLNVKSEIKTLKVETTGAVIVSEN